MYTVTVDPHTHTLASLHAYSTVSEHMVSGAKAHMQAIGITDHISDIIYAQDVLDGIVSSVLNMVNLPDICDGVRLFRGAEVDIVDDKGNLYGHDRRHDWRPDDTLLHAIVKACDLLIASIHKEDRLDAADVVTNTARYVGAVSHPFVNILGHCARPGLAFDVDEVLLAAKAHGTLIEINNHSFHFTEAKRVACRHVAERCAALSVPVAVSSDAHSCYEVGHMPLVFAMFEEIGFPEELIANRTLPIFLDALAAKK